MNVTEEMVRDFSGGIVAAISPMMKHDGWRAYCDEARAVIKPIVREFLTRLREQWEAERLQPTPGPPDLYEKLRDAIDAWVENGTADHKNGYQMCVRFRDLVEELLSPPEPELPKCPWCNSEMIVEKLNPRDEYYLAKCSDCGFPVCQTEAEAIAAARKGTINNDIAISQE